MDKMDRGKKIPSEEDDGIVRHYSREHRLSRASPEVNWLVKQYDGKRPGLFGSLLATPALRFTFFTVVLFLLAGGLLSFLYGRRDSGLLGGQLYAAKAFRFGETVYVTVLRRAKSNEAYTGSARMAAYIGKDEVGTLDFVVSPTEEEEYRMAAQSPGKGGRLSLEIEAAGAVVELTIPIR